MESLKNGKRTFRHRPFTSEKLAYECVVLTPYLGYTPQKPRRQHFLYNFVKIDRIFNNHVYRCFFAKGSVTNSAIAWTANSKYPVKITRGYFIGPPWGFLF